MKNIFYNSLLIFAILVLFGCGHSNGINANTQKSNIDTMENKLVAMGYQNLFQFGDRSEMYEIWQNGDNQKSVEAIITNPKSSFHAKFLAAEILRRFEIKISSKYDAVLSKSYIYALEHSSMEDENFIGIMGNSWGFLYEFDDVGYLGKRIVDFGEFAVHDLIGLLSNKSHLLYEGSEEATIGNAYQYRVKDFAAFYISKIKNIPVEFYQEMALRDKEIERFKRLVVAE